MLELGGGRLHTELLACGECAPALWLMATEAASDVAVGITPCGPEQALALALSQCALRWGETAGAPGLAAALARRVSGSIGGTPNSKYAGRSEAL